MNTYKDLLVTGNVYTTGNTVISDQLTVTGNVYADRDIEVVRNVNVGGNVSINGLTSSYFPMMSVDDKYLVDSAIRNDDGTVIINSDTEITGNLQVYGTSFTVNSENLSITDRILDIANNNVSHTLDIGLVMEHPDYNIALIHHGDHPHTFSLGYTSNGYADTHVLQNVINEITFDVWGNALIQNNLTVVNNDLFVQNGQLGIKTLDAEHDLHVVGNAFVTSNITTTSNVIVTGAASSSSTTTGALQVTGGVGIVENLNVGGVTKVWDASTSTTTTTGALKVAGGVGIVENLFVGGTGKIENIPSTSTATGALKVTGGVGIVENLFVGGTGKIENITSNYRCPQGCWWYQYPRKPKCWW